jgi:hypothetical protein
MLRTYQGEFNPSLGAFDAASQEWQHNSWRIKGIDKWIQRNFESRGQRLCQPWLS